MPSWTIDPTSRRSSIARGCVKLLPVLAATIAVTWAGTAHSDDARIRLSVVVSGVTNARGHIRLAVCTRATFLGAHCPYVASAPARIGAVTLRVDGVAPGEYAVQAFHDEDDVGKIKLSLLGIPEEGFGFSNNAPILIGPPRFSDAAFRLDPGDAQLSLRLRHFD